MRRLFPYKKLITAILLVAASVFLMNVTGSSQGAPSFWEGLLSKGMQPCLDVLLGAKRKVADFRAVFQSKQALLGQSREMKQKLESLETILTQLRDIQNENQRLRKLLGFREQATQEYRAADVIGRSPSKWFSTITISLGKKDGVEIDAPVVSGSGLVGRVIKMNDHSAQVLLLTDPESGVGSIISRSRDYGIVLGGSGQDTLVMRSFQRC